MASKTRMLWLACLGLGAALGAAPAQAVSLEEVKPEHHPRVESLPEFARVGGSGDTQLILRGKLPALRRGKIERSVREVARDIKRRFGGTRDKTGLRPVDVCLLTSSASYREFARAVMGSDSYGMDRGFFAPYRRLVVVDLEHSPGSLRHELVHALMRDEFGALPDWLDEGLASLYVSVKRTPRGLSFLSGHRLSDLRAARTAGRLPEAEKLVSLNDRDLYGTRFRTYYALARFVLLYLDRRGKLSEFVHSLCAGSRSAARQREVLGRFLNRDAFLSWVDDLLRS